VFILVCDLSFIRGKKNGGRGREMKKMFLVCSQKKLILTWVERTEKAGVIDNLTGESSSTPPL
jgi:hypothetical protein